MAADFQNPTLSQSKKFLNWIKAALAVLFTKEGIEPIVYDEILLFQQKCLEEIATENCLPVSSTCSSCSTENVVVCPTNRICNVERGKCSYHRNAATQYRPSGCPNKICNYLKSKIQNAYRYDCPAYKNTDAKQWCSNPWEIAKCYMPPDGYKDVTNAADTDFNGVISVIIRHKGLDAKFGDVPNKKLNIFEQGREVGKAVRHSPNLEVEDADLDKYFSILIGILTDPRFRAINKSPHNAIQKLAQLKNDDLIIGKDIVRKVIDGVGNAICKNLRSEMDWHREKTEKQMEELLAIVKMNTKTIEIQQKNTMEMMQEAIQEIYKRMESATHEIKGEFEGNSTCVKTEKMNLKQKQVSLPILKPEDGNLIILDNFQLDSLLQNSDLIWEGRNVKVLSTKDKVPDLNIRVAIKEITSECEGDGNNPLSIANEMIASRVKHFAIAPFIAYFEKELQDGRRSFYLMSPFFENGNLLDCIRRDRNSKPQDIKLDKDKRKKILYHIASGIDYLHTKETGYRGTVLHVDLTSNNVVLDKYWNARLIDFGLACELNEKQTAKSVTTRYGKEGYIYTKKDSKLRVYDDYHNFGVVIREMLTGKEPTEGPLRDRLPQDIAHNFQHTVWEHEDKDANSLLKLSERCIESATKDKRAIKSSDIVKEITTLLKNNVKFTDHTEEPVKCVLCLVNNAVTGRNRIAHDCNKDINICVSCMRNSHLNPIRCPHCSEKTVFPEIGHTFAALLISGNGEGFETFRKEIKDIKDVLVSKWPCVIGIREENVKVVAPSSQQDNTNLLPQFDVAIEKFKKMKGLKTLIVYFTGHNSADKGFMLGNTNDRLSIKYLRNALAKICKAWGKPRDETRILAFFDCCEPQKIDTLFTEKDAKIIQINVCSRNENCVQPFEDSLFKKFFIQALTRKHFNEKCYNLRTCNKENRTEGNQTEKKCSLCSISGSFVSVFSLHEYIDEHMKAYKSENKNDTQKIQELEPRKHESGITVKDAIIAYNVDFAIGPTILFEFEKDKTEEIQVSRNIFSDIEKLKEQILESIIEKENDEKKKKILWNIHETFSDVFCLQIHNGQKEKEVKSMVDLSSAMIGKRKLVFSYRKVEQIRNGRAVLFQPDELVLRLINESNIINVPESKDRCMKTIVFQRIKELDGFIAYLNKKYENNTTEKECVKDIKTCFIELAGIWRQEENQKSTRRKLKVWFSLESNFIVLELVEISSFYPRNLYIFLLICLLIFFFVCVFKCLSKTCL